MALRRTSNGMVTAEQFVSDKQRVAKEKWNERARYSHNIREQNKVARAKRSPRQQLNTLDARLGIGIGAAKERKKLIVRISIEQAKNGEFIKSQELKGI